MQISHQMFLQLHFWISFGGLSGRNFFPSCDTHLQSLEDTLRREEGRCRELIDIEPERSRLKWPLLTLCLLLKMQRSINKSFDPEEELKALYFELAEIDPLRRGFYRDAIRLDML